MKKEFAPNDAGDATDWFMLHGDFSLAMRSQTPHAPTGDSVVVLERKDKGASDDEIERVATITASSGAADSVNGSERMRGVVHRLRCTTYTNAGAIFVLRSSGLIDA